MNLSRPTPSTVLAAAALFFALGGSALAVSDAVRPQARCAAGSVRGVAAVNGEAAKGIANVSSQFTSSKAVFGMQYNCGAGAPQVRRLTLGVYEVRFPGNSSQTALVSGSTAEATVRFANGVFTVNLWAPGRQDAVDVPFVVAVL
jgi:hypothetical protein